VGKDAVYCNGSAFVPASFELMLCYKTTLSINQCSVITVSDKMKRLVVG